MPAYNLESVTCSAPTAERPFLSVKFRRDLSATQRQLQDNPIYPATALQLSIANNKGTEIFMDRAALRELSVDAHDIVEYRVDAGEVPRFNVPEGQEQGPLSISVHAWQGWKLLGTWEAGKI
jgi:hypothetical protein